MIFKNFRVNCILRLLLLSINICLFFILLFKTNYFITTIIIGILPLIQLYSLFKYIERPSAALTSFLESIKASDFSQRYTSNFSDKTFKALYKSFTEVTEKLKKIRMEKEEHFRYLQTLVEHIDIGLIIFKYAGEVDLVNKAAKKILKVNRLTHIKEIKENRSELADKIINLRSREKSLLTLKENDEVVQVAISAKDFILSKKKYRLVSIQNIQSELDEKEMEAWQKLIHVLTHEIMNSITPISSLASTAHSILKNNHKTPINQSSLNHNKTDIKNSYLSEEELNDVTSAIQTIEKRSKGLLYFVSNYRKLYKIPAPVLKIFPASELFNRIKDLSSHGLKDGNIKLIMELNPENIKLTADSELLEQVILNLVKNSIEALKKTENPFIKMSVFINRFGRYTIQVEDNGSGISQDLLDKIFVPFFTTKRKGSGIGLSLSRQIIRMHNGTIRVKSELGKLTTFTLRL